MERERSAAPVHRAAREEWRSTDPPPLVVARTMSTVDPHFDRALTTRGRPLFLAALGHQLAPEAPSGVVSGLAEPSVGSAGVQRSFAPPAGRARGAGAVPLTTAPTTATAVFVEARRDEGSSGAAAQRLPAAGTPAITSVPARGTLTHAPAPELPVVPRPTVDTLAADGSDHRTDDSSPEPDGGVDDSVPVAEVPTTPLLAQRAIVEARRGTPPTNGDPVESRTAMTSSPSAAPPLVGSPRRPRTPTDDTPAGASPATSSQPDVVVQPIAGGDHAPNPPDSRAGTVTPPGRALTAPRIGAPIHVDHRELDAPAEVGPIIGQRTILPDAPRSPVSSSSPSAPAASAALTTPAASVASSAAVSPAVSTAVSTAASAAAPTGSPADPSGSAASVTSPPAPARNPPATPGSAPAARGIEIVGGLQPVDRPHGALPAPTVSRSLIGASPLLGELTGDAAPPPITTSAASAASAGSRRTMVGAPIDPRAAVTASGPATQPTVQLAGDAGASMPSAPAMQPSTADASGEQLAHAVDRLGDVSPARPLLGAEHVEVSPGSSREPVTPTIRSATTSWSTRASTDATSSSTAPVPRVVAGVQRQRLGDAQPTVRELLSERPLATTSAGIARPVSSSSSPSASSPSASSSSSSSSSPSSSSASTAVGAAVSRIADPGRVVSGAAPVGTRLAASAGVGVQRALGGDLAPLGGAPPTSRHAATPQSAASEPMRATSAPDRPTGFVVLDDGSVVEVRPDEPAGPATVQREDVAVTRAPDAPATPSTTTAVPSVGPAAAAATPGAPAARSEAELHELCQALYPPLRRRLCRDLLLDRERAGYRTDIRF